MPRKSLFLRFSLSLSLSPHQSNGCPRLGRDTAGRHSEHHLRRAAHPELFGQAALGAGRARAGACVGFGAGRGEEGLSRAWAVGQWKWAVAVRARSQT